MVKCVQLVGRLRDRATALFGGKIRIVVATLEEMEEKSVSLMRNYLSLDGLVLQNLQNICKNFVYDRFLWVEN